LLPALPNLSHCCIILNDKWDKASEWLASWRYKRKWASLAGAGSRCRGDSHLPEFEPSIAEKVFCFIPYFSKTVFTKYILNKDLERAFNSLFSYIFIYFLLSDFKGRSVFKIFYSFEQNNALKFLQKSIRNIKQFNCALKCRGKLRVITWNVLAQKEIMILAPVFFLLSKFKKKSCL